MKLLPTVEEVLKHVGLKDHDCHPGLPRDEKYRGIGIGGGAISIEEAMLIIGVVWATRPDFVIELGTFNAGSTLIIGAALKDLKQGNIITVDLADKPNQKAQNLSALLGLPIRFVNNTNSLDFLDKFTPQESLQYLVFSDTDIPVRPIEVDKVLNSYPRGTVIAVHDTSDLHPFGPMKLKEKINDVHIVELPSPRGLSILRV